MKSASERYKKLQKIGREIATLEGVRRLLEWDQETYMPPAGGAYRAEELESIASLIHKQKTGAAFTKALGALIQIDSGEILDSSLSPQQTAALREWRRDYLRDKKLPTAFVKTFASTTSRNLPIWAEARKKGDFKLFAPGLKKIVDLTRKKADLLGFHEHPYDALIDLYEPGMTTRFLNTLFEKLKLSLISLLKEIQSRPSPSTQFLEGNFDGKTQLEFGQELIKAMGLSDEQCRLDLTNHPFCSGINPKDLRLTTRIHPTQLMQCLLAIIHEAGHGLYEQNLPEEHFGTPLCEAASIAIHESQSLFWEKRVGKSYPFWQHFFPKLQQLFPGELEKVSLEKFYQAINVVHPSLIRIEADEVTYCLHVILRYEIERDFMDGSLKVQELPEAWNEKMRSYLGIVPHSVSEGCLQDIHWAFGLIGYFPTYALGNLYSVQIFHAFEAQHPEWKERAAGGDLSLPREWLKEQIHQHGREYTPAELIRRVTGQPLSEQPFADYLAKKYST